MAPFLRRNVRRVKKLTLAQRDALRARSRALKRKAALVTKMMTIGKPFYYMKARAARSQREKYAKNVAMARMAAYLAKRKLLANKRFY